MATILETINKVLTYENEPARQRELLANITELSGEQIAAIMQAIESKADQDGTYENLIAGYALHLLSTDYTEDKTPYLFRKSGGSADIGSIEEDTIIGGSIVWNQLVSFIDHSYAYSDLTVTSNAEENTLIINGTVSSSKYVDLDNIFWKSITMLDKHIYLAKLIPVSGAADGEFLINLCGSSYNNPTEIGAIITGDPISPNAHWIKIGAGTYTNYKIRVNIFDITQMFGITIANLAHEKELRSLGAAANWLKSMGFFVKNYYPYAAGTIKNVEGLVSHDMTGFNQWDEETETGYYDIVDGSAKAGSGWLRSKNPIPCLPNASYCLAKASTPTGIAGYILFYDASENYLKQNIQITNAAYNGGFVFQTPKNCYYIKFYSQSGWFTNVNICLNLSGSRNGEYQPYVKHSYPLDSTLTLRGIPKVDASGNLYYDGDVYHPDGRVERWIVERAYQEGDVSDGSTMLTDGTNTIYKVTAPTIESAQPFASLQIVDGTGTEQYVINSDMAVLVPVGHDTKYFAELFDKLDQLPDVPSAPEADGTYVLKCTVSGGSPTYAWESVT